MFLGSFEPNLMDKGRIALPKKIREELGGSRLILTIGFETCIFGFTEKMWEEVTKPELSRPLFSDKEGRDLRRKMYAEAINIELDSQGRCIIPKSMMDFAGISSELVVIGAGDHFEIWNKKLWEEYRSSMRDR
ncbi:division/cell wall cluster transcriptional repressor MraZ [Candidatus Gottesmanbacteria bacterium]|nr:division/cell wall cluster transcriptional repressor MraZ [Candidatus Gottesmanbacteria bacterium]